MHDLSFVRDNIDLVRTKLRDRNSGIDLDPFLKLDEQRRSLLREVEGLNQRRNQANDEVTRLKRAGGDAAGAIAEGRELAERIKGYDVRLKEIQGEMEEILMRLPNLPHETVPVGRDTAENVVVRT